MPGTKNSGRKKKVPVISPGISISNIDDAGKSSSSKPRGRPKRTQVADLEGRGGDDAAAEIQEQTVKTK